MYLGEYRDRTCELGISIGFWSVVDHRLRILPRFTITFVYIFLPIIFGGTRGGKVARIDPTIVNTQGNWRRLRNYCYYMRVQQTGTSEVAASSGLIQSTSSKSETKLVETRSLECLARLRRRRRRRRRRAFQHASNR